MHAVLSLLLIAFFTQAAAPAPSGGLTGRVTAEGTNAPIAGARVIVFPMHRAMAGGPGLTPPQAMTDQDGRFVFNNLAPGDYRLDVQKSGFASTLELMTRPRTYTVAEGQSVDVTIVLPKGAVISGKLLDQKGEPVSDARVMALRRITPPGNSNAPARLMPAPMQGSQQTNDIGEFRVSGLQAGEYFIAAVPRAIGLGGPPLLSTGNGGGSPTVTTTYYPGTTDQAGAQPITVSAGGEVPNIIFTIQSAPGYLVSGTVVDENGAPIAHATVMLINDPRNGTIFLGPGGHAQAGDDGRFSIGDVTPGTYRVNASMTLMMPAGGGIVGSSVVSGGSSGVVGGTSSGGTFTTWSVTSNGSTTVTTTSNTAPQPQEVVVSNADVRGLRVVARRLPGQ